MMTVLNILYEERPGGPQWRALQVAKGLRRLGIETVLVIPRGDPTFASLLREASLTFHELPLVRLRHTRNPVVHAKFIVRFWGNVGALRKMIRRHQVDMVHTNGIMNVQAVIAARLEKVPLVWHLNDTFSPWYVRRFFTPQVERWSDGIAIAARAVGRYYFPDPARVNGRLHLLPAPVDTKRFNPATDGEPVRAELGISPAAPIVGLVANLSPGKGIEYLLEAAPAILRRVPDTKFLVVGARLENRLTYWRELVRRREELGLTQDVIFTGRRSDMPAVMRSFTVAVQASETEACPMAVLEASASGVPVVASAVGGTPEVVEHHITGLLVLPKSPEQLAAAVIRLLGDPEAAQRMGAAGRTLMRRSFSLEACVERHAKVYKTVLQRTRFVTAEEVRSQRPELHAVNE